MVNNEISPLSGRHSGGWERGLTTKQARSLWAGALAVELHDDGFSWPEVGDLLGCSAFAAESIADTWSQGESRVADIEAYSVFGGAA